MALESPACGKISPRRSGHRASGGDRPSVRIDDLEAAAAMTRYLLSLGHRDIGFIVGAVNQDCQVPSAGRVRARPARGGVPWHP